jgi:SPP1 family predicted phage head-tail adaptor|nr:MAG TPA: head closure knob [Caudoviricetes sp.]
MRDVSCKLLSTTYKKDTNSIQTIDKIEEKEVPIIDEEDIYANEYYQANQNGYKPTLRLVISSLNYNNEQELIYMDVKYTIIRIQKKNLDELILICERKINNV